MISLEKGKRITSHIINQPYIKKELLKWEIYSLKDVDYWFLHRGFEQQGFNSGAFLKIAGKNMIDANCAIKKEGKELINNLGFLLEDSNYNKYEREFFANIDGPFYTSLKNNEKGETGKNFYKSVKEFLDKPNIGKSNMWKLIFWMMNSCRYLNEEYENSFKNFLFEEFGKSLNKKISFENVNNLYYTDWKIIEKNKPWLKIYGIGEETFSFILRDAMEISFKDYLIKHDSTNIKFFHRTGLDRLAEPNLIDDRDKYLDVMQKIKGKYSLREINIAIFLYCSKTFNKKPFCSNIENCNDCGIQNICLQDFSK
jgi:hypothetical protein